jgi:hypothetical protein
MAIRRTRQPRGRTLAPKGLSRDEQRTGASLVVLQERPQTRGDCLNSPRPCPWVGCKYHNAINVNPDTGSIGLTTAGVAEGDLSGLVDTCALDVADRGGVPLDHVGQVLGISRERVRQIEDRAIESLEKRKDELEQIPSIGGYW